MVYGNCKSRMQSGKNTFAIKLNSIALCTPTNEHNRTLLAKEMRELTANLWLIEHGDCLLQIEALSKFLHHSSQYIIANIAFISGSLHHAASIYLAIKKSLPTRPGKPLSHISDRIDSRISACHLEIASRAYRSWIATGSRESLSILRTSLERVDSSFDTYRRQLLCAASAFLEHRPNTRPARRLIKELRPIKDAAWRYSSAFLDAYDGRSHTAYQTYLQIAHKHADTPNNAFSVIADVEAFIERILQEEPERHELRFLVGILNYKFKGDTSLARQHLQCYILSPGDSRSATIARRVLEELNHPNHLASSKQGAGLP